MSLSEDDRQILEDAARILERETGADTTDRETRDRVNAAYTCRELARENRDA